MHSTILNGCIGVNLLAALALLASRATAAPAGPVTPPHKAEPALEIRLQEAFQRHDAVELERAVRRMSLARLRAALDSDGPGRDAAIAAVPLFPRSWLLLSSLIQICAKPDPVIAVAAAEAVRRIVEDVRQLELHLDSELPERFVPWARELARLAADRHRSLEVRVRCVQALAQLLELVSLPATALLSLLADPEPRVRRAATELFIHVGGQAARSRLARLVATDSSKAVARAAGVVLCAEVPLQRGRPAPNLTALQAADAVPRLRELSQDAETGPDEILDIARCLRRSGQAADREVLRALQSRSASLRDRLELLED